MPRSPGLAYACILLATLAACAPQVPLPDAASGPTLAAELRLQAPQSQPNVCWAEEIRPAIIETVTEQIQTSPERRDPASGVVLQPARYSTVTRQQIVSERAPIWFRTPCPAQLTADFIASLQRALQARGHFKGQVSATVDAATRRALRSYQAPRGLPSGTLSLAAARELGLIAHSAAR